MQLTCQVSRTCDRLLILLVGGLELPVLHEGGILLVQEAQPWRRDVPGPEPGWEGFPGLRRTTIAACQDRPFAGDDAWRAFLLCVSAEAGKVGATGSRGGER